MIRTALAVGVCVAVAGCSAVRPAWSVPQTADDTRRATTAGEVIGGPGRYGSHAWLGIPFAAAPVGPLRWRAPQPPAAWKEPLKATKFQRACVQPSTLFVVNEEPVDGVIGSEDCLYLNVWAPVLDRARLPQGDERLPVMVWIHGGGNSLGTAASYDLGHLATGQRVLGVSVHYRLGPLGWFRHAALRGGIDPLEDSGNYGTLDLIQALEWVRDNAAAFGGNPDNVTIFGESAGGQNVYSLLLSPRAKGLFHRAIAQSPVLSRASLAGAENFLDDPAAPGHQNSSNEALARMLTRDGRAPDRAAAKQQVRAMPPEKIAEYLRGKSAAEVIQTYLAGNGGRSVRMLDMPLVLPDGAVQPKDRWIEAFARPDGWNQVPVLAGTNRDEAKLFLFLDPRFTWKLFGVLPRMRDAQKYESSNEAMSRIWKSLAIDEVAEAMAKSGATGLYAYRFDWGRLATKLGTDLSKLLGAAHGMEIPFAHGHFEGQLSAYVAEEDHAEREALSNAMMGYWGQFARTGKPGTGGPDSKWPQWLPYDVAAGAPKFMTLDATPAGLRMGNTVERVATVIAETIADPRVPDRAEKCEGLKGLVKAGFLTPEQLAPTCP
ncbi:MAG: Carboxylesterase superfamily protein [Myxococcaceae bacterium]|nr:Carboxylesterase superfamily protein [Myxococcaceae bacterium]